MTHEELYEKVAKFVHGMDSHGNLLRLWNHEKDCATCERLTDFIEKILEKNKQVWKFRNGSEVRFL